MENNIETNITTNEKNNFIEDFIEKIKNKLDKEKILVIDRFEGEIAVCEDRDTKNMINIERKKLPSNIKEGDVIKSKNDKYELDEQKTQEIRERINNKIKNLFND